MSLRMNVPLIACAILACTAGLATAANPVCPPADICVAATEKENSKLVLVDLTANTVTDIFVTPDLPDSLVLDPQRRLIYSLPGSNQIRRYDAVASTDTLLVGAPLINVPQDMILDPTGNFLYVSNFGNATITRTDLSSCFPCTTIVLPMFNISGPEGLAFDNAGNLFVLAGFDTPANGIYRIDKTTGAVLQKVLGLDAPNNELDALTFDPSTNFLFATSSGAINPVTKLPTGSDSIYKIDPVTLAGVKIATVPQPDGIINNSHGLLYVASRNDPMGGGGHVYSVTEATVGAVVTKLTPVPTVDDLGIVPAQPPVGLKTFAPKNGLPGFTSTLTIKITNPNPAAPLNDIGFVDNLPAGVVVAATPNLVNGCGGTVTGATAGSTTVTLAPPPPNPLAAGASCTVKFDVTDNNVPLTMSTNCVTVTSSNGGPGNQSCDTLVVLPVTPDLAITKTHVGNFTQGQMGATYTITVSNTGNGPTAGTTTVTDTLPAGLTFVSGTGGGFTCSAVLQVVTCTNPAAIPVGTAVITLTVNVAANAPAMVTNSATVTNPGVTGDPDDTATDPTIITPRAPDLAITKTHVDPFTPGQMGAVYTITVTNTGNAPTVGTTTVVDTLPAGLTFVSGTGGGFTCSAVAQVVTCTNPAAIAAGASAVITLTVNVAANAPAMVTNSATVTNPGITGDPDDTATDPTNIRAPVAPEDDTYQLRYFANLDKGESYVNLTNAGTLNGFDPAGRLCVNVYTFDPAEELISCCACPITPNGLASLSVRNDLISNTLTPGVPTSVLVKLLSSLPIAGVCNAASPNAANLVRGMRAWATTIHLNTAVPPAPGVYQETETPFSKVELSPSELSKLTSFCGFIQANGSGFGLCKACRSGALGAEQK